MHTVVVRKMPAEHYRKLRAQAVANGRSMEAELRALVASTFGESADPTPSKPKSSNRKKSGSLLTAKERQALKPDAQAALQRLREMFADRKGEGKRSMVEDFRKGRREMWGDE
jgi:plasmid stability protein